MDFREMVSSKRWFPAGKSREPSRVNLLAMVLLVAKRRFPALRWWVREISPTSLKWLLPENSTDERVFSPLVGTWKVRRAVFEPSLRSGIVELWAWSVRLHVRRVRKRFIMPLIEGW